MELTGQTHVRVVARFRPPITEHEETDDAAFLIHAGGPGSARDRSVK